MPRLFTPALLLAEDEEEAVVVAVVVVVVVVVTVVLVVVFVDEDDDTQALAFALDGGARLTTAPGVPLSGFKTVDFDFEGRVRGVLGLAAGLEAAFAFDEEVEATAEAEAEAVPRLAVDAAFADADA